MIRPLLAALLLTSSLNPGLAQTNVFIATGGAFSTNTGQIPRPDLSMCLTPPASFAHVWTIDPVFGHTAAFWTANPPSSGIVGDAAHPWSSLQAVFSTGVSGFTTPLLTTAGAGGGPIAPGDEILLNNGTATQYGGAITIPAITNSSFVTIAAAPGQTPVLSSMTMVNDSEFAFEGISVQSTGTGGAKPLLIFTKDSGSTGLMHDVVFDHMSVSSASNATTATWAQADWANLVSQGVFFGGGTAATAGYCMTLSNSQIFNTANSMVLFSDNSIMTNNVVNDFADDGLDFAGNNIVVQFNTVENSINIGDNVHVDAMQGFVGRASYNDVLIDSNTILWQTAALPFQTSADAAMWSLTSSIGAGGGGYAVNDSIVLGNGVSVKVTSVGAGGAVTGITALAAGKVTNGAAEPSNPVAQVSTSGGGTGATINLVWTVLLEVDGGITANDTGWVREVITNNVVVFPQNTLNTSGCTNCLLAGNTALPAFYQGAQSGGTLQETQVSHNGSSSSGVVIRNNLVADLSVTDPTAFIDHNIMMLSSIPPATGFLPNFPGGTIRSTPANTLYSNGSLGTNNLVDTSGIPSEITTFDNQTTFTYDFHLLSSAPARGFGTSTPPGPLVDITGFPRSPAFDVGAYAFH